MTRDELLARLRELAQDSDRERAHGEADDALLAYINDDAVTDAFNSQTFWYA